MYDPDENPDIVIVLGFIPKPGRIFVWLMLKKCFDMHVSRGKEFGQ
jgi:hypothetical protein